MLLLPLRRLMVPLVLLCGAWLLRDQLSLLKPVYRQLLDWLPYAGFGLVLLACFLYNRARLFTLAFALALAYWLIDTQLQSRLAEPQPLFVYSMLVLALPLTALLLLVLPERGLRNRYGLGVL